jgi:hypothetical protein
MGISFLRSLSLSLKSQWSFLIGLTKVVGAPNFLRASARRGAIAKF